MTDLAALDAANAALQKDPKAAKTVKAYAAEATKAIHFLQPVPTPAPPAVALPVGPFTEYTSEQNYPLANPARVIRKIYVHDVTTSASRVNGITMMEWPTLTPAASAWTVEDIKALRIGNYPPTHGGTEEAGIAFGYQVNAARLVLDASWMAFETWGQCRDSHIVDITIGREDGSGGYTNPVPGVGGYLEHFSRRIVFERYDVRSLGSGFTSEWWYDDPTYAAWVAQEYPTAAAGKAGTCCNSWGTGRTYCPPQNADGTIAGNFMDAGTWGNNVATFGEPITFWGPGDAIGLPNNLAGPTPNVVNAANCIFNNAGRKVYYHDRVIG